MLVRLFRLNRLERLWRSLGEGACPRLQSLRLEELFRGHLVDVAEAVCARPEGCKELTGLSIAFQYKIEDWSPDALEALGRLLRRTSPGLETLSLLGLYPMAVPVVISELFPPASSSQAVARLRLQSLTLSRAHALDHVPSDALLQALARGAAPSLRHLCLEELEFSDDAWRALGGAMGIEESQCLRQLRSLELRNVLRGVQQLEALMRGVGDGHGCPHLESMKLDGLGRREVNRRCGAVLARAFKVSARRRGLSWLVAVS